jgi:hypothetical protein
VLLHEVEAAGPVDLDRGGGPHLQCGLHHVDDGVALAFQTEDGAVVQGRDVVWLPAALGEGTRVGQHDRVLAVDFGARDDFREQLRQGRVLLASEASEQDCTAAL